MKNLTALFLIVLATCLGVQAHAALKGVPFSPEEDKRFNALELGSGLGAGTIAESKLVSSATSGLGVKRIARLTYDPTDFVSQRPIGTYASGVILPLGAVVSRVYGYDAITTTTVGGTGTVQLVCGAQSLFNALNWDGFAPPAVKDGVATGAAAAMVRATTACNLSFTVAVNAFTAGKIDYFVEYVVAE